ncbi:hypothetical protein [Aquibium sp. ELW1220]|jgi:hypothetical protein|uniref:hypothetical protein n=1 Tax=Aquibium sp. ELW1220 TaxID=2976766 RepID=UPI0025B210F1|nr:hypothetical protein [Aquibium sp. ELW1220]MDN2582021.1 hypothetical protein [Aquibium sp. ELW1220]
MGRVLLAAIAWGLAGMVALPMVLYFSILALSHLLDPRCAALGGPGCATGAFGIALASAMPAFALFFLFGVVAGRQRLRRRAARSFAAILDGSGEGETAAEPDEHRN